MGAPFKFKKSEEAEEGAPTADLAAADDDASADQSASSEAGQQADVVQGMSMGDKRVADAAVRQLPHDPNLGPDCEESTSTSACSGTIM